MQRTPSGPEPRRRAASSASRFVVPATKSSRRRQFEESVRGVGPRSCSGRRSRPVDRACGEGVSTRARALGATSVSFTSHCSSSLPSVSRAAACSSLRKWRWIQSDTNELRDSMRSLPSRTSSRASPSNHTLARRSPNRSFRSLRIWAGNSAFRVAVTLRVAPARIHSKIRTSVRTSPQRGAARMAVPRPIHSVSNPFGFRRATRPPCAPGTRCADHLATDLNQLRILRERAGR